MVITELIKLLNSIKETKGERVEVVVYSCDEDSEYSPESIDYVETFSTNNDVVNLKPEKVLKLNI